MTASGRSKLKMQWGGIDISSQPVWNHDRALELHNAPNGW
jgi:hypothetical protein